MDNASLLLCVLLALGQLGSEDAAGKRSPQDLADRATFDFDDKQASIWASVMAYEGDCEIHVLQQRSQRRHSGFKVTFVRGGKKALTFFAHARTVFAARGNALYLAGFSRHTCGCRVFAFDLGDGRQLWSARLSAAGMVLHSLYDNAVNLRVEGKVIKVLGRESAGSYLELLDCDTGRQVGHRAFQRE